MFGILSSSSENRLIEKVTYQIQDGSRYTASNSKNQVTIDTRIGRVYINNDTFFTNVPESVWNASFQGELSPRLFLEDKIGQQITQEIITSFQELLQDLIEAEFKSKD